MRKELVILFKIDYKLSEVIGYSFDLFNFLHN
jgi:hypothetical protein